MGVSCLEVVLGRDHRAVPEPARDHVGRESLHPVGRARGPHVVEEPGPGLLAGFRDDPFELGPQIRPGVPEAGYDSFLALMCFVEEVLEDLAQLRSDRDHTHGVTLMIRGLDAPHHQASTLPIHIAPFEWNDLGRAAETRVPAESDDSSPFVVRACRQDRSDGLGADIEGPIGI